MGINFNIRVATHFILLTQLTDGIRDLQFKHIGDYIDAVKILKDLKCKYTTFQANEGDYHHIFTNEQGLTTLSVYYR